VKTRRIHIPADRVTKRQHLLPWGNAIEEYILSHTVLLDPGLFRGKVAMGIVCDVSHAVWPE